MLETLFLDAGGVLVHPNWPRMADHVRARGGRVDVAALHRAEFVAQRELDVAERIATTNDDDRWSMFVHRVFDLAGVELEPAARHEVVAELKRLHDAENLWELVPDEVPVVLDRFLARGVRLVVVSNANGTVRRKLERVGLGSRFALVVDSHEEGLEKPDPRLFARALERAGADPARTVHVGDFYRIDVVGAQAAGLRAVLLDRAGLHTDRPCERVSSLSELYERLSS